MFDLSDEAVAAYVAHLMDLEDALEAVQSDKKQFFESTRDAHGRDFVASLKLAVKTALMDSDKRQKAEAIDAGAERILEIMRKGLHVVARGAPARESARTVPEHDAETGEIIDTAAAADQPEASPRKAADPLGSGFATREDASGLASGNEPTPSGMLGENPGSAGAPATEEAVPPVSSVRRMSMTPLEPRKAGNLKGFGFTVSFEDQALPITPGGTSIQHMGRVGE